MADLNCLQCGESQAAIQYSQSVGDPIYCAAVDCFGECPWELPRHRFRDWSDKELIEGWRVLPEHVDKYRRITNGYDIDPAHRAEITTKKTERDNGLNESESEEET